MPRPKKIIDKTFPNFKLGMREGDQLSIEYTLTFTENVPKGMELKIKSIAVEFENMTPKLGNPVLVDGFKGDTVREYITSERI